MPELETKETIVSPTLARKSEIDAKAKEIKTKRALPPKPGNKVSFAELLEWLPLLQEDEQRERVMIYMYRVTPKINRKFVDPNAYNNIDVFSGDFSKFDESYIIDVHGGGKYKLVVKDTDAANDKEGHFTVMHEINAQQYPPKLDLNEVVWNDPSPETRRYRAWAISQKLIDENNMPVIEKKAESQGNSSEAMVQAMKLAMDFAAKMDDKQQTQLKRQLGAEDTLGKSIGEILLEKMKQDDPNKQLQTVTTLLAAMKTMNPEPKQQTSELATVMPLLIAMMQSGKDQTTLLIESMKSQQTLLVEMMKAGQSKGEEVDEYTKMEKLLSIARQLKGGSAPAERSLGEQLIEAATQVLPGALNIVGNIVAMQAASRGVGAVQPPPPTNITAAEQAVQNAKQANGGATPPQNGLPAPMTQDQKKMALQQFAPLIQKALGESKEGWEFAQDVENLFGAPTVAMIVKDGVEPLLTVAKSLPEFWNPMVQTYGEPHLTKWVTSLVNYREEAAQAMEEEDKEDIVQ